MEESSPSLIRIHNKSSLPPPRYDIQDNVRSILLALRHCQSKLGHRIQRRQWTIRVRWLRRCQLPAYLRLYRECRSEGDRLRCRLCGELSPVSTLSLAEDSGCMFRRLVHILVLWRLWRRAQMPVQQHHPTHKRRQDSRGKHCLGNVRSM